MVAKTCENASSASTERNVGRTERVLMLDPLAAHRFEEPIVLDQKVTHLRISSSGAAGTGQVVIERSPLGWRFRSEGEGCLLNGIPAGDAWLHEGDRLMMSNTEFHVRPATTDELLEHLPRFGQSGGDAPKAAPADRQLGVAAKERDLADWEQCLTECEADVQTRVATMELPVAAGATPDLSATWVLDELDGLRTDRSAAAADRKRLDDWMTELKRQRALLQQENDRLATERAALAAHSDQAPAATANGAVPAAEEAEAVINSLAATIAAEMATDAKAPSAAPRAPRRSLLESRARLDRLRIVANQSTRRALSQHFWRKHRSALLLKAALVGMSFALAVVLYVNHGVLGSPASTIAWGATAIGLITASGLVHTLTEINRLNHRTRQADSIDVRPSAGAMETSPRS